MCKQSPSAFGGSRCLGAGIEPGGRSVHAWAGRSSRTLRRGDRRLGRGDAGRDRDAVDATQAQQRVTVNASGWHLPFHRAACGTYKLVFELAGSICSSATKLRITIASPPASTRRWRSAVSRSGDRSGQSPVVDLSSEHSATFTSEVLEEGAARSRLPVGRRDVAGVTRAGAPDVGGSQMAQRPRSTYGLEARRRSRSRGSTSRRLGCEYGRLLQLCRHGRDPNRDLRHSAEWAPGAPDDCRLKAAQQFHGQYEGSYQGSQKQSSNRTPELIAQGIGNTRSELPLLAARSGAASFATGCGSMRLQNQHRNGGVRAWCPGRAGRIYLTAMSRSRTTTTRCDSYNGKLSWQNREEHG